MRILQVCPDFPPWVLGGAAETFRLLSEAWRKDGNEVDVICSIPASKAKIPPYPAEYGVRPFRLFDLPFSLHEANLFAPMVPSDFLRLQKFVARESRHFDLVVVHGLLETISRDFLIFARPAIPSRMVSIPYAVSTAEYSWLLRHASNLAYRSIGTILVSRLPRFVVLSSESEAEMYEYFGPLKGKQLDRLILGIDTESFANDYRSVTQNPEKVARWMEEQSIRTPFLFAIGRNVRAKGFDILLESFHNLSIEFPQLTLVLAGDPTPFTATLRGLVRTYGLQDRVSILGRISSWERMTLVQACEVFVIPSRKEGYGLNAVQARILSKTTVATKTGAHEVVLDDRATSYLVATEDPSALTEGIRQALLQRRRSFSLDAGQLRAYDIHRFARALVQQDPPA